MGMSEVLNGIVEEKLLNLHTAFIGKVVSVQNASMCSVKPLDKIKAYGQNAKDQSVITRVPVLNHVRHYTLVKQSLKVGLTPTNPNPHPEEYNIGHVKVQPIKAGDIVLCVCAERDISASSKGKSTTPPVGHHQIGNAIVVGLFGGWDHE